LLYQKEGKCTIPTVCLVCRLCVSESRNLYQWVLSFPLKDCSEFGNFVIILIWNCYNSVEPFSFFTLNVKWVKSYFTAPKSDRKIIDNIYLTVDFPDLVQALNCIIPTICLCSIFCVSERGKMYHTYSMFPSQESLQSSICYLWFSDLILAP
jgi:hypothetical protein